MDNKFIVNTIDKNGFYPFVMNSEMRREYDKFDDDDKKIINKFLSQKNPIVKLDTWIPYYSKINRNKVILGKIIEQNV